MMMAVVIAIARCCTYLFVGCKTHIQNIIKMAHFQIERNEGKEISQK